MVKSFFEEASILAKPNKTGIKAPVKPIRVMWYGQLLPFSIVQTVKSRVLTRVYNMEINFFTKGRSK